MLLRRAPSILERVRGHGPRANAVQEVSEVAERFSTLEDSGRPPANASRQEDINIVSTLMYGRDRVNRSLTGSSATYRNREDSPLVLSDVPMLLQLMRKHGAVGGGDGDDTPHREPAVPNLAENTRVLLRAATKRKLRRGREKMNLFGGLARARPQPSGKGGSNDNGPLAV